MIYLYNALFPLVFLFFVPGIVYKYFKRGGAKENFSERFSMFSDDKKREIESIKGKRVWIHAVSVGETQLAVDFINAYKKREPDYAFIISTTTTTGQELALNKLKGIASVIFCPVDYFALVKKTLDLVKPELLIIFETEIWPSMIYESRKRGIKVVQVNSRISDHSFNGYKRFSFFIGRFMSMMNLSCAQTKADMQRIKEICPELKVVTTGTMKFDQHIPANLKKVDLKEVFGEGSFIYLLGASTHPGEEKLIIGIYKELIADFPALRLILVPRHAERAPEITSELDSAGIVYFKRSSGKYSGENAKTLCLLADTTGEMLSFINESDIVIMGKCFAGNSGGHNVIEPALMGKPIVTGRELTNFRFVMKIMKENNALIGVDDSELKQALRKLLDNPEERRKLGETARAAVIQHVGATERTIQEIEKVLKED